MKNCQKGFSVAAILLSVLVVLGIGVGAYYFGKSAGQQVPATPPPPTSLPSASPAVSPTTPPTATPVSSPTSVPATPNSNLFTDPELGISFNYTSKKLDGGSTIGVKQIGNKVFVYMQPSSTPENGQYLEMFSKDKNDSLLDAVKKKILAGYSLNDCLVKNIKETFTGQTYPANFELVQITVPTTANDDMETLSEKAKKCPASYTAVGGLNYFLFDPGHPDKFIFFSIGQYAIDSGIGDKNWQNTIKFL